MLAIALGVILAGCAPEPGSAPPTPAPARSTEGASPAVGSAEARLEEFSAAMRGVWEQSRSVAGRDYIDALVAAGFDRDAMELTFDETSVGIPADSIQFSVRIGEACLVGQVGPSVPQPAARVMPGLPAGTCLIGETRPIDW